MEPRISLVTLGVSDLARSKAFYSVWLGVPPATDHDDVAFFATGGTRLSLYGYEALADDVGPGFADQQRSRFPGITLAHNCRERHEVDELVAAAEAAGGTVVKPPAEAFWGGYSGYVADPDGYLWEIAWGAFPIAEDGQLVLG
ncbi:VOC family protein [Arsenicicoccus sp. MKL-02]|uniref:VOC family protein n=1 Tax=Arsenicicoccus cauae TaxID=2663847 RepID=A0A6I3ISZ8_9MICO|nr:VOC family protein [Arsenicicoccus cauae]MTB71809.1 VOC family protein [Arsenicicoccus cauae]